MARAIEAPASPQRMHWLRRLPLRTRIGVLVIGLLALFLAAAILAVWFGSQNFARQRISDELIVGQKVLRRSIEQDQARLVQAARVLSADFGFRDAVASADAGTVLSALANQAGRIEASAALQFDTRGQVVASTVPVRSGAEAQVLQALLERARTAGGADGIVTLGGRPMLVVLSPVKAPVVIGWVVLGFALDDRVAAQLGALTGASIAIVGQAQGRSVLQASASSAALRGEITAALAARRLLAPSQPRAIELGGVRFLYVATPLDSQGQAAILQLQSLDDALKPYRQLAITLFGLLMLAFFAAVAATRWIAGSVSGPIQRLARAAAAISAGDYGQTLPVDSQDEIGRLSEGFNAMSCAVQLREAEIRELAAKDVLTGLLNRTELERQAHELLQGGQPALVLIIDIDRFKAINNVLGFRIGDQVICEVADRLRMLFRDGDAVARLAADEFALIAHGPLCEDIASIKARVEQAFATPFELAGSALDVAVSLGASRFPDHGNDVQTLIRNAEMALKCAKRQHSGLLVFEPAMDQSRVVHLSMLSELRRAVERDELRLYLQPKISLRTGRVESAEALVRWQHPERGFIPPGDFIPFAEQTGRIGMLTRWMLRQAMLLATEQAAAGTPLQISVNVSTFDIQDDGFPAALDTLLGETGGSASQIRLEITESGVMDDPERALSVLAALRERGFTLSIDDFGTGYSSLAYLRRMPVSELKIDRSFVRGVHRESDGVRLLRSTIELGHNLDLSVVAEGVETIDEWQTLAALGCDYAQGFYASKPLPIKDFLAWRVANAPLRVAPTD
ncbi:EAL domain-containing protein [Niveibacterium sp. 24ML]|uniref:putative bifunctional diguanylate cyclase/phosphodiesterase n=1 Tax=Niveibacterium sp. 24ML TaxID=2985512 RepID=UPI00226FC2DE|nr:EAL domain-containing protein [Niveibacterium sp. 24ML]MCX9155044.1 EAL domain-containing protein [Niveibacterium sp. 24ML]